MIDFAHTARVATNTNTDKNEAIDEGGLLFGFDTLIHTIANMMDEETQRNKDRQNQNNNE